MFFIIIIGIDWMINSGKDSIVFCLKIKFLSFCKHLERYSTIPHKRESTRPDFTNSKKTQIQINAMDGLYLKERSCKIQDGLFGIKLLR